MDTTLSRKTRPTKRLLCRQDERLLWLALLVIALLLLSTPAHAERVGSRDAALLVRAVNLYEGGQERAGIHTLTEYLSKQPDDVEARRMLADFYGRLGLYEAARTEQRAVVAAVPLSTADRKVLMELALSARDWHEALDLATGMLTSSEDPEALRAAARGSFNLNDPEATGDYLARITRLGVEDGESLNMLGLLQLRKKDYRSARSSFLGATEHAPEQAMYHNNLGYALELQHNLEGAWMAYDRALSLDPGSMKFAENLKRIEGQLKKKTRAS